MLNSPLSGLLARKPKPRALEDGQRGAKIARTTVRKAGVPLGTPKQRKPKRLAPRLATCFRLAALGQSNFQIAHELGISENTVKVYMARIHPKYPRGMMVAVALRAGTITVDDLMAKLREFEAQNGIVPVSEVKA